MKTLPLYAGLLALLFLTLSVRTLMLRERLKIAIGDAGNPQMLRAMRVHANCAEYVPFCLILIYLVEVQGASMWLIHALGLCLLLGRLLHAYGVGQAKENLAYRVVGMVMTFTVLSVSSLYLLYRYLQVVGA